MGHNLDEIAGSCSGRRAFLHGALRVAAGGVALVWMQTLPGCGNSAPGEVAPPLRLSLADLLIGSRQVFFRGEDPVEIQRTATEVTARSLLCTHRGCTVIWRADTQTYDCPCHEGRFDAAGRVILGPPPQPLRELPVILEGDTVIVGA